MDYGYPQRRKTKGDKKAKARYNKYKTGGRFRANNVQMKKQNGQKWS